MQTTLAASSVASGMGGASLVCQGTEVDARAPPPNSEGAEAVAAILVAAPDADCRACCM